MIGREKGKEPLVVEEGTEEVVNPWYFWEEELDICDNCGELINPDWGTCPC